MGKRGLSTCKCKRGGGVNLNGGGVNWGEGRGLKELFAQVLSGCLLGDRLVNYGF